MQTDLTVHAVLGAPLAQALATKLEQAQVDDVLRKVRDGDATLWAPPGTPEVANRLGWLTIASRMLPSLPEIEGFVDELRAAGISEVLLLGMGGSSLAPEVLRRTHQHQEDQKAGQGAGLSRLRVLDSTNPGTVKAIDQSIAPEKTLFLVSSKSGGTIEPRSMLEHYFAIIPDGAHFAAITDPGTELEALAQERGFARVFAGDPDIGGRYSALSAFGIVPGTLIGADVQALLGGAQAAWETPINTDASIRAPQQAETPGQPQPPRPPAWLWLGVALSTLASVGRDKLTFIVADTLDGLGLWLEQLFAESTGKQHRGILPVAEEPLLSPQAYGDDRVFVHISDIFSPDPDAEQATEALVQAGHPLIRIPTTGAQDLGRIFMLAELAVAVAGWGLEINPFNQPNVQEAKDATNKVLAQREHQQRPSQEQQPSQASSESSQRSSIAGDASIASDADLAQLRSLLADATPPNYVAIMGYVPPSQEFDAAIAELREQIMLARRVTTTFGYGPRFLHSTGQFHKGGPPIGRFLQLVHSEGPDVAVPGKPYTFGELHQAQADGDLQTLRAHSLPAQRVTLRGDDPAAALRKLTQAIVEGALHP